MPGIYNNAETVIIDGHVYTKSNRRMKYDPEFHENHRQPYTEEDMAYMCAMWKSMQKADIALAIGKTVGSLYQKKSMLVKQGLFEHYKKLGKDL